MMIDHFNLPVCDLAASAAFYDAVLPCLGYQQIAQDGDAIGYGIDHWAFGIVRTSDVFGPLHCAFIAPSPDAVMVFHQTALNHNAICHGAPGYRPDYGERYFAAYIRDIDGHNIEAVYRGLSR